jgi:hypothetical protein
MIDNRCCGRVKVVITRRVAQSHAAAPPTYFRMLTVIRYLSLTTSSGFHV